MQINKIKMEPVGSMLLIFLYKYMPPKNINESVMSHDKAFDANGSVSPQFGQALALGETSLEQ